MEKTTPRTLRASAALPAAGAYDSAPVSLPLSPTVATAYLHLSYTRGAVNGSCEVLVEGSVDGVTFYSLAVANGGGISTGAPTSSKARLPIYGLVYQLPVPPSASAITMTLPVDVGGWTSVRITGAEVGVTATPGTLAVTLSEVSQ